jgi:hypothetical protein
MIDMVYRCLHLVFRAYLLAASNQHSSIDASPKLRSGIYLLRLANPDHSEFVYAVYWPEPTTWDDDADSPVRRNRVTFMRYAIASPKLAYSLASG